jgi:hypothetical protein
MQGNNATDDATDAQIKTIADDAHIYSVPADTSHSDLRLKAARDDDRARPAYHKSEYTVDLVREFCDSKTVVVYDADY